MTLKGLEKLSPDVIFEALPNHLQYIVVQSKALINPRRIWLFGSRARQDAKPTSDFDIAFEFEDSMRSRWPEFCLKIREDVPSLYEYDLVDLSSVSPDLRKEIEEAGIKIYENER